MQNLLRFEKGHLVEKVYCKSIHGAKFKAHMEEYYFLYNKPATLLKVAFLRGCFSRFSNCTNGTKSRKASDIL